MDFTVPQDLLDYLKELDVFIEAEIKPLEDADDNVRFSTTGANMLGLTSSMAGCRTRYGKG